MDVRSISTMEEEMKTIMENLNSLNWIFKLSPEVFMSCIGTILDDYEAVHTEFNTVQALEMLHDVSIEVHSKLGLMRG